MAPHRGLSSFAMFGYHRFSLDMPAKSNTRRSGRKNRPGGRGKNRVQHLPLVSAPPQSRRVLTSYATAIAKVESAVSAGTTHFFRANSPYDPDSSGVGSSTFGYGNWTGVYQNYKVHRVTVRCQVQCYGMSTGGIGQVVVAPVANQSAVPSNPYTWKAIPYAKFVSLTNSNTGAPSVANMVVSYDLAAVCHVSKQQFRIDMDYAGTAASNPDKQIYILFGLASIGSTTPVSATLGIEITYEVEWFNPLPLQ